MIERKSILCIVACFLCTSISAYGEFHISDSVKVKLNTSFRTKGWIHTDPPLQAYESHYLPRWGYYPDTVIWENTNLDSVGCYVRLAATPDPYVEFTGWDPQLEWDDIESHLVLIIENTNTQTTDTLKLNDITKTGEIKFPNELYPGSSKYKLVANGRFSASELPDLSINNMYRCWSEYWDGELYTSKNEDVRSDTTYFIRSKIETSMDSLQYSRSITYTASIQELLYLKDILRSWPDDYYVNKVIFHYYFKTNPNCDSLQYYGARYIGSDITDPFPGTGAHSRKEVEVERAVEKICGE